MHSNESSIYQKLFCAGQGNEGNFNAYIRGEKAIKSVLSFQRKKLEETKQTELTVITRRKW